MKRILRHPGGLTIIIGLMSAMLLAGCGAAYDSNRKDNPEIVKDSEEPARNEDSKDIEEPKADVTETALTDDAETDKADKSEDDPFFADAFREGQVYNNGNYFVRIKDKVYFRNISPDSMDKGATFGEFLHTEFYTIPCPLISYDINTCESEEIGSVYGTGELYACPKGFYIGEIVPDMFDASCTNLYDPVTKEISLYCKGLPLGISENGEILVVEEYGGQYINTVLYKDGREIARLGGENIYYKYVGFAGETLIVILQNANDEYILCSVDETGYVTELGEIGNADNGYGETKQFQFVDGYVYVSVGYYEGTGHFLSHWEVVKAKPGVGNSLEIAIHGDDVPSTYDGEGPDPDVLMFFFDTGGAIDCAEHVPYQVYIGEGDKENDLLYYDDIFEECLLVKNFIDRSDYNKCSIIQDMESIAETAFVIYADAEADSEYDVGWRTGYRMTGWHICAIPFGYGHLDDDGLAKDIIYFQGSDTGESKLSGDPLEGLVSNDILAKFRESNPVKDPDSIEQEALALGEWVQKSINSIPAETREKGEKIGQHYEFWFGTDIGNNFDDNFPRIYATYYSMKDFNTSDGKRSSDYYDRVMRDGLEEYTGDGL